MQLLNVILFWIFFGLLSSHLAKRQGRSQLLWFVIGLLLGLIGVLLIVALPFLERLQRRRKTSPQVPLPPPAPPKRHDYWFYLDASHQRQGPLPFSDLAENWKKEALGDNPYLWTEGMEEWKRLEALPELLKDLETTN